MQSLQKPYPLDNYDEFQIDIYPETNLDSIIIDYTPVSCFTGLDEFIVDINRSIDLQIDRNQLQEISIPLSIERYDDLLMHLNSNYNDGKAYYAKWKNFCYVICSSA
ncbi:MAG: hypothetical protein ACXAD7_12510 [Candidatus Kariarchaeaceae archaeon]|jgi:hypothetical protein